MFIPSPSLLVLAGLTSSRTTSLRLDSSLTTIPSASSQSIISPPKYRSRKAYTTLESSTDHDESDDEMHDPLSPQRPRQHRPLKKRAIMESDDDDDAEASPQGRPNKVFRRSLAADTSTSSVSPAPDRMFGSPMNQPEEGTPPSSPPEEPAPTAAALDVSAELTKSSKGRRKSATGKSDGEKRKKLTKKQLHESRLETERLKAG